MYLYWNLISQHSRAKHRNNPQQNTRPDTRQNLQPSQGHSSELFYCLTEIFFKSALGNEPPKQQEGVGKFQITQWKKAITGVKVSQEQSRSVDAAKRP